MINVVKIFIKLATIAILSYVILIMALVIDFYIFLHVIYVDDNFDNYELRCEEEAFHDKHEYIPNKKELESFNDVSFAYMSYPSVTSLFLCVEYDEIHYSVVKEKILSEYNIVKDSLTHIETPTKFVYNGYNMMVIHYPIDSYDFSLIYYGYNDEEKRVVYCICENRNTDFLNDISRSSDPKHARLLSTKFIWNEIGNPIRKSTNYPFKIVIR